jgi:ABC-2 type transport system ATP-binding protein
VWDVLLGLKKHGKTVFLTTHYMEEAELLADMVAIISRGKIIAMDSPVQLIETNADYLILTLQCSNAKAFEVAGKMGLDPQLNNHKNITVRIKRMDDIRNILNVMNDAGTPVLSMDVRKPNLEQVFLKLTGEALHEGGSAEKEAA